MTKSQILKATLLHGLAFTLAIAAASTAKAAVMHGAGAGNMQTTKEALDLSMMERVQALKADPRAYENLKDIMFTKSNSMDLRWKATTAIARVGGEKARADLMKALAAPEWFMRNAGLIAMSNIDRTQAVSWAKKLMNDKALVVRAAAVDVISQAHDTASTSLLWQKLYSRENFRNRQSLFIRRRIVEALADLDGKDHASKFVALLQDKDESLHEPAMEALERITKHQVGNAGEPVQVRRAQWQQWYKANKASL